MITALQRIIHRLFQLLFHVARDFAHPEDHPGQDAYRYQCHDAFEQLLFPLGKLAGRFVNEDPQAQAQRRRQDNANPHDANQAAALGAFEIAGNQADNQRRLQPFA